MKMENSLLLLSSFSIARIWHVFQMYMREKCEAVSQMQIKFEYEYKHIYILPGYNQNRI